MINITILKLDNLIKITTPVDYLFYYEIKQSTLYITLFMQHKKNKINVSTNNEQLITNIQVNDIKTYNINILPQGDFVISKKIKKNTSFMNLIYKNINGSLFNLKSGIFIFIDNNGVMHYYNDSIQLNDFNTLDNIKLINISEHINEYIKVECYNLTETITPVCIDNTLYSRISNVISNSLSYINPLAYLTTNTPIINIPIEFYFNTETFELYKKIDNKVKILKPNKINIPIFIDNISYNENNDVIFSGLIQPKYNSVKIIFNSFFITHQLIIN